VRASCWTKCCAAVIRAGRQGQHHEGQAGLKRAVI
jgi:hypothetical protein